MCRDCRELDSFGMLPVKHKKPEKSLAQLQREAKALGLTYGQYIAIKDGY